MGGLVAVLAVSGLIVSTPRAGAGCQDNPLLFFSTAQKCDGPVDPDGTWERCVVYYYEPPKSPPMQKDCHRMGPVGQQYPSHAFYQPDAHIDP
ncbi:CDGP domain-containing protein [Mycolicibacter acidiphilus]|uniref:CDGP domain-containing protein n=1 Tax=Mycolicibacter acidiphilus TaxID=2835306 RepID=UPI0020230E59